MKKALALVSTVLIAAGLLAACGDNNEDVDSGGNTTPDNENNTNENDDNVINNENNDNENDIEENNDNENDLNEDNNNADDNGESAAGSGDYDDQEDLRIGDTAQISSNTGEYEITINSVRIEDEIDGEPAQLEYFIVAEVTVQNLADDNLEAQDATDILELSYSVDASGSGDISHLYDSLDGLSDELGSNEEETGEIIFEAYDDEELIIMVNPGLISSGGVHNNAVWTFDISEAE